MEGLRVLGAISGFLLFNALAAQVSVTVDPGRVTRAWDVMPVGLNLNTLTDGEGNRVAGARPLREAIAEAGVTYLRFPGGEKSDVYQWAAPPYDDPSTAGLLRIGPSDWPSNDPDFWDLDANAWANDNYHFDEFMADCQSVNCEPVISVALDGIYKGVSADGATSLTREQALEMAVAWVRYANVTRGYGIKYWLLGNETWNGTTYAGQEPPYGTYGTDAAEFARAMKAVDPDILIGINGDNRTQLVNALNNCADAIDFVDVHTYPVYNVADYDEYLAVTRSPLDIVDVAQAAIDALPEAADRERLFIVMTETSATGFNPNTTEWDRGNNLGQAIANFDILATVASDPRVRFVQYWNSRFIAPDDGISHPYDLFTATNDLNASGQALTVLTGELLDEMVAATTESGLLRSFATRSRDGELLTILLVNKSRETTPVSLAVDNYTATEPVQRLTLSGPAVTDTDIAYVREADEELAGGSIDLEVPPTSVTVLRLTGASLLSLPVNLTDFHGTVLPHAHCLEWSGRESGAFRGYGLEYREATGPWREADFFPATGGEEKYHYHRAGGGRTYYRLRLEEADGTVRYSAVISLDDARSAVDPYPNPTTGPLRVDRRLADTPYRIYGQRGRLLRAGRVDAGAALRLDGLHRGVYTLLLADGTQHRVVKR